jgi:xylulokinase
MSDPLLIGIDAGTTNIKTLATTPDGVIVAEASRPNPAVHTGLERAHYEPEAMWKAVVAALREVTNAIEKPECIVGIAVASMAETAVPLDGDGKPTFDAIAWFDKRATGELDRLIERVGRDRLFEISGLGAHPIFGLCKMMWLKANEPEAYARTERWLHVADYIAWRLSGVAATDYSLAGRTFALDLKARAWSEEAIDAAGIKHRLFQNLVASGTPLGPVLAGVAAETGLPESCKVAAGGFDHAVGAFGVGALRPGIMLNSMGTTEAFLQRLDHASTDPMIGSQGYASSLLVIGDKPNYFIVGGTFTAGAAIEWFRKSFTGNAAYATLETEASSVPAGSLGVGFLPHLRLAPPPRPYPDARGAFWGLSTDADRAVLFRALLEGLNYEARQCADAMMALPGMPPVETVLAIGGGTRDQLRMSIKASLWNRSITVADISEAVGLGAAKLAGLGAGIFKNAEEAMGASPAHCREVAPDAELARTYERLYQDAYRSALDHLRPLHDATHRALHL